MWQKAVAYKAAYITTTYITTYYNMLICIFHMLRILIKKILVESEISFFRQNLFKFTQNILKRW